MTPKNVSKNTLLCCPTDSPAYTPSTEKAASPSVSNQKNTFAYTLTMLSGIATFLRALKKKKTKQQFAVIEEIST